MLTIVTINYNNAHGLQRTLSSLLAQDATSLSCIEWILIDGCSTDNSLQALNKLPLFLTHHIISEPDSGIYNAMNKGIRLASRPYCLFLNSGDTLFHDTSLSNVFNALMCSVESDIILFAHKKIYRGNICRVCYTKKPASIPFGMPTSHQSIIYKTKVLNETNYDESFQFASDYAHLCLLYKRCYSFSISTLVLSCFYLDGKTSSFPGFTQGLIECNRIRMSILKWPLVLILLYDIWLIIAALPVIVLNYNLAPKCLAEP